MDTARETSGPPPDDRLGSWKAIAAYMKRDVTTVQRWERREGMPVHRHQHDRRGSVYAYRAELDAWLAQRSLSPDADADAEMAAMAGTARRAWRGWAAATAAMLAAGALILWWTGTLTENNAAERSPLTDARFTPLTDFEGVEHAAAISRDGRHVAFLADRTGTLDAWVTEIGTGDFRNLTNGAAPELLNPETRSVGFTPDGTQVLLWTRVPGSRAVATWAVPTHGGALRPYMDGVVEMDWSGDGRRLVYHTAEPGDPTFVVEPGGAARPLYTSAPGIHNHFQLWAPDERWIYFVRGTPPDETDLWRIAPDGSGLERLTFHDSRVLYPTIVAPDTLLYLATTADGAGPWLYSLDVGRRVSRRIGFGVEQYTSLAASADGRRLVATVGRARSSLWRVPLESAGVGAAGTARITVPTVGGGSPRAGPGYLLFVSAKHDGHALQKLVGDSATELWSAERTRIVGGPAIAPDGRQIAFTAEGERGTRLYVAQADRPGARLVAESLEVRGAPAWAPDGRSLTVAALRDDAPRLVRVPLDGAPPAPLVGTYSINPAWSPDGAFLVYAAADDGPDSTLKAINADGTPHALPEIRLPRGARRACFTPDGAALIVLLGEMRYPNFWRIDLASGARRQLTNFGREFTVRDFDVAPDGKEIVFDRREDDADVVLIERGPSGR